MIQLLAAVFLAVSTVPTGPAGARMRETERSPLELRPASFQPLRTLGGNRGGTVLIVVADYLTAPLSPQLAQFQSDIASEGWTVEMQSMSGGTAPDLRALLQSTPDLDGAVFVGFLPCAWYEDDLWGAEEFPCELFFMDLDGSWTDSDMDGLYDDHTGEVAPEIWVGRIDAHTAFGPELPLLAEYFEKNHTYRTGSMGLNPGALAYNDDDWSYYGSCGLNDIYGSSGVTVVNSSSQTTAENYLYRLGEGYEFVHLMSHSCPWGHTFKIPGGMAGTVMAPEISQVNPRTAFLQLFSCSNARWVEEGCLGNWYLYGTDYGLLVTGAAKTGSMLDFEQYYGPLGTGLTFGEAFREWWEYQAQGGFSSSQVAWFYGNALLGDPTLKPLAGGVPAGTGMTGPRPGPEYTRLSTSAFSDCYPSVSSSPGPPRRAVAAWLTGENGRLDVAARLYEEGSGWEPVIHVDPDEYWDVGVSACYHDTSPWVAWSDFEYATYSYRIKTACGPGLSQVTVQVEQDGYQINPVLTSTGDQLWLAWLDWGARGGTVMVKGIDGVYPAAPVSSPGSWAQNPRMVADGTGTVHLAWEERSPEGSRIMWCSGDSLGFSTPVEVSSGQLCHSPSLDTRWTDMGTCLTWIDEDGVSAVRMRTWEGSGWGAEETVHSTVEKISGVYLSSLPEPMGSGLVWQEGSGASAAVMALPQGGSDPFTLVPFGGPAWSPVSTAHEILWAGNEGSGWEIFLHDLAELGTGEQGQPGGQVHPGVSVNPVRGSLQVSLEAGGLGFDSEAVIYDLAGRAVLSSRISLQPGCTAGIDCSPLPSGVYMIDFGQGSPPDRFLLLK